MKHLIKSLLFPPICIGCGERQSFQGFTGSEAAPLCSTCQQMWKSEKLDTCAACAKPVSLCECLTRDLMLAKCKSFRKLVYYRHGSRAPIQNKLIYRIKQRPSRRCTDFLAEELKKPIRDWIENGELPPSNAVITYVPRGIGIAFKTGTDQAKALAKALSVQCGIPMQPLLERRLGAVKQQKKLHYAERRKYVKKAFCLKKNADIRGKSIVLVDDIVTTGLTMAAGARILYRAGAQGIFCLAPESDDCNQNANISQPHFFI